MHFDEYFRKMLKLLIYKAHYINLNELRHF